MPGLQQQVPQAAGEHLRKYFQALAEICGPEKHPAYCHQSERKQCLRNIEKTPSQVRRLAPAERALDAEQETVITTPNKKFQAAPSPKPPNKQGNNQVRKGFHGPCPPPPRGI